MAENDVEVAVLEELRAGRRAVVTGVACGYVELAVLELDLHQPGERVPDERQVPV